jgi:hypothetical protein
MINALTCGVAGAAALTIAHQAAQRATPDAPRVDIIAERALAAGYRAAGRTPPGRATLHYQALAGDIVSNSLYYTLVSLGDPSPAQAYARGAALGVLAGLGAVLLPPALGLGRDPVQRTPRTAAMTIGWYTLGGLAAAATHHLLSSVALADEP